MFRCHVVFEYFCANKLHQNVETWAAFLFIPKYLLGRDREAGRAVTDGRQGRWRSADSTARHAARGRKMEGLVLSSPPERAAPFPLSALTGGKLSREFLGVAWLRGQDGGRRRRGKRLRGGGEPSGPRRQRGVEGAARGAWKRGGPRRGAGAARLRRRRRLRQGAGQGPSGKGPVHYGSRRSARGSGRGAPSAVSRGACWELQSCLGGLSEGAGGKPCSSFSLK